ncbi:MAG: radical SAM protein [Desulfobacula sp.]|uniref:elongator complex protein 3 n=1 Tax=Desulfobacula sp. TaxID=2593537 RepID=UPI001DC53630|nr:radical SAM protein [Desulfobacula sp.]MBT3485024.1 radical SAM protein [Desulfobacula sp.]MBT3804159.1 radical SAM protein [Desulfobacula sp.]MBT4198675.1 radical SAM protein [Desulfobacula sp.]MBT4506776.1 radical SAM protein [Desulfobacula sp.]
MIQVQKPLVIPVFIPHAGCPHQCAFCNQSIITSQKSKLPDKTDIHNIVQQYLQYKGKRESVELAFFGGNFLGLGHDKILQLLDIIQPYIKEKKIDGIRFSTRPDTIARTTLDLIRPYNVSVIELGVQSMNQEVLIKSKRGHTGNDTINAIDILKAYPFKIGVQVMVGLPGDTEASLFESTKKLARLAPDFARIYPLMVLKGSMMERWYCQGRYQPLGLEKSIGLVKKMVGIFRAANVKVIRIGLQASDMMEDESMVLAGPWHPAFGHLVFSEILYDLACSKIEKYKREPKSRKLFLRVHPKSESQLRGNKNSNFKRLGKRYSEIEFSILLDEIIPLYQVEISGQ